MTEKEKMLGGELYDSRDAQLIEMYHKARRLILKYNGSDSKDGESRMHILKDLLGHIENGVWIEAPFFCDYGENISIGENTFVNTNCMFLDDNQKIIGKSRSAVHIKEHRIAGIFTSDKHSLPDAPNLHKGFFRNTPFNRDSFIINNQLRITGTVQNQNNQNNQKNCNQK